MQAPEIQNIALSVLRQYNPDGLVPFPFATLVQGLGDVELLFLENMPEGVSGAIFRQQQDTNHFVITIDKRKPVTRQYFTTAHEFGHYFLHKVWLLASIANSFIDYDEVLDVTGMLLRPDRMPTDPELLQKEREANTFAAELIMPADKVREYWNVSQDAKACAEAFQVSQLAMTIRLQKLRLIS